MKRTRKKRKLKKNIFKNKKILIVFIIFVTALIMSTGYAIYSQILGSNAISKILMKEEDPEDIFVKKVDYSSHTTCGYELFNAERTNDSLTVKVDLPAIHCIVVYDVTIMNNSTDHMEITRIFDNDNNPDIIYEFTGLKEGDIIPAGMEMTATLTIQYQPGLVSLPMGPDGTVFHANISFEWEQTEFPVWITYSTTNYTRTDVEAEIHFGVEGVTVTNNNGNNTYTFVAVDGGSNGNGTFTFNYSYKDTSGNNKTGSLTAEVTWIDREIPNAFSPIIVERTETEIEVQGATTDVGVSGIAGYYYSNNNGLTWTSTLSLASYTFTNLNSNTGYSIVIRAVDNAGNYRDSSTILVTTEGGTNLPIEVLQRPDGTYFDMSSLPNGITPVGDYYDGQRFTFVLAKPPASVQGMQNFTFALPIINGSQYTWTGGNIGLVGQTSGAFNNITPTISATSIAPGGGITINHRVQGRIDHTTTDYFNARVTFMVNGVQKELFIDFYWLPWNGYFVHFERNDPNAYGTKAVIVCVTSAVCQVGDNNNMSNQGKSFQGWAKESQGQPDYPNNGTLPINAFEVGSKNALYAKWN